MNCLTQTFGPRGNLLTMPTSLGDGARWRGVFGEGRASDRRFVSAVLDPGGFAVISGDNEADTPAVGTETPCYQVAHATGPVAVRERSWGRTGNRIMPSTYTNERHSAHISNTFGCCGRSGRGFNSSKEILHHMLSVNSAELVRLTRRVCGFVAAAGSISGR